MTQHTPGPWVVNPIQLNQIATPDARLEIARATVLRDQHETIANARLIAAAPDLLEALVELSKSFIGAYTNDQRSDDEIDDHRLLWENKARELIARITGDTK